MADPVRRLVKVHRGPLGTTYGYPFCRHAITVPRGGIGSGRGYGLRTGGAAHSRIAAHIRAEHAERLRDRIESPEA